MEPQLAVAADEGADDNGLVEVAVQSDETDTTSVSTAVVRLQFGDDLHGPHLGCTAQRAGREGVDELLDAVGSLVERTAHTAHEVDNVTIELHVLIEIHFHTVAVATQVVTCKVHQHHVLGILLGVVAQELGSLAVLLHVARTLGGTSDGVDESLVAHDAVVGLGRRTEDTETSEIEVEEVGRRVDATQGTIELEVIALILLHKAATHHNLEHVATQAMLDTAAHVRLVLLVGKRREGVAHGVEVVGLHVALVHCLHQLVQLCME